MIEEMHGSFIILVSIQLIRVQSHVYSITCYKLAVERQLMGLAACQCAIEIEGFHLTRLVLKTYGNRPSLILV